MKKLLALLIALASLSCFTACNDDEKESKSSYSEDSKITIESETEPTTEKTTKKKIKYEKYEDDFIIIDYPKEAEVLEINDTIIFGGINNLSLVYSTIESEKRYEDSYIYELIESEKEKGIEVEKYSYGKYACAVYPEGELEDEQRTYVFTNENLMYLFTTAIEPDNEILSYMFRSMTFKNKVEENIPQTEPITEAKTEKPTEPKTEPTTEKKPENNSGSTSSARASGRPRGRSGSGTHPL